MKPRALDLFSGAGGATRGLQLAGFHVTGVDLHPQPRYVGDAFHQADAMTFPLEGFDFIWASPPCQRYSITQNAQKNSEVHPDLIDPIRQRLIESGVPWVIENVLFAPLRHTVRLCGSIFGQNSWRHRIFECSHYFLVPGCRHDLFPAPMNPYKSSSRKRNGITGTDAIWRKELGLEWMSSKSATLAIPPAYSKYIGEQMLPHVLKRMRGADFPVDTALPGGTVAGVTVINCLKS